MLAMNDDRSKAIEAALLNIEKKFGKGSIMRLGEREISDIPAISTTSLSLDAAIGIGGVPRGRVIEIYGPESSGKTTLALHIVAEAQKAGGVAAYVDAEHAMDAEYAGKLGVDIDQLLISQIIALQFDQVGTRSASPHDRDGGSAGHRNRKCHPRRKSPPRRRSGRRASASDWRPP